MFLDTRVVSVLLGISLDIVLRDERFSENKLAAVAPIQLSKTHPLIGISDRFFERLQVMITGHVTTLAH